MDVRIQESSINLIPQYVRLYKACFGNATHLNAEYLSWLYAANPAGIAVGADAICGDEVVGQVIAIPGRYQLYDSLVNGLVAVNVSVHPKFQGRYLFKRLGLQMCEYAAKYGYTFVTGVANRAATPGWVRQMGFQLVSPLEARIGIGSLGIKKDYLAILSASKLRRVWDREALLWRTNNPANRVQLSCDKSSKLITAYASARMPGISAFAEFMADDLFIPESVVIGLAPILPRVFLGLIPAYRFGPNYVRIPGKLKPSPLNLIYKNLKNSKDRISPFACFINFLDSDAF